jgi:hypothetical protein
VFNCTACRADTFQRKVQLSKPCCRRDNVAAEYSSIAKLGMVPAARLGSSWLLGARLLSCVARLRYLKSVMPEKKISTKHKHLSGKVVIYAADLGVLLFARAFVPGLLAIERRSDAPADRLTLPASEIETL